MAGRSWRCIGHCRYSLICETASEAGLNAVPIRALCLMQMRRAYSRSMTLQTPNQLPRRAGTFAVALGLTVPLGLGEAPAGGAGSRRPCRLSQPAKPAADLDALKKHDEELEAIRKQQQEAAEHEAKLRRDIEAISADRRKLNEQLIATAARVRSDETRIAASRRPLEAARANRSAPSANRWQVGGPSSPKSLRPCNAWGATRRPPCWCARGRTAGRAQRHDAGRRPAGNAPGGRRAGERSRRLWCGCARRLRRSTIVCRVTLQVDRQRTPAAGAADRSNAPSSRPRRKGSLLAARQRAAALAHDADNLQELIAKARAEPRSRRPALPGWRRAVSMPAKAAAAGDHG